MVYEILLESKKPLMAKRIAYNIYQKYNGYRMSRFIVRDIIWKQMKDDVEYDSVNYTYAIKKSSKNNEKKQNRINNSYRSIVNSDAPTTMISQKIEYNELLTNLQNPEGKNILIEFKNLIQRKFLNVNTGNKKFDQLIATIVKDNKITKNEEVFLKQKTLEYGLPYNLIEKAKEMLNSNNPYLDNIIHLIFEDGKVKDEELLFLKEKKRENEFSKSFLNQRFWQIGICYYLKDLSQINNFQKVIKLWHIGNTLGYELINIDTWLLMKLDIHKSNNIEDIIFRGVEAIEEQLKEHIRKNYNFYNDHIINDLYKEINLLPQIKSIKSLTNNNEEKLGRNILKILELEKIRIGSPDVNLLVENIKYRIEKELWE